MSNLKFDEVKIGDIIYEYGMGCEIKSEVITSPERLNGDMWAFTSKMTNGEEINYSLNDGANSHYNVKVYNYQAYVGMKEIKGRVNNGK